jgi:hypothetical protein
MTTCCWNGVENIQKCDGISGMQCKCIDIVISNVPFPSPHRLFSLSIFTTIGYGHLSARTVAGRLLTMLYALGGIPLLMMVLDELGRLLSRLLLNSWFLIKCVCRRAFRSCTRQSWAEIRALDTEDQEGTMMDLH